MPGLTVPEEFDDWPFDARNFVLAQANTALELRQEICSLSGIAFDEERESDRATQFSKEEMAMLVMALGGPDRNGAEASR
ncbi:hypothetical protein ACFPYI_01720 [Halomarina salina]|uniref:Uncharacterized protein n=1 Tax=Halomarina salina TaxID=1872699 RepID=A0ABD5RHJ9_9EURY|nr:hypothetical protein [Halomarina salina]